MVDEAAQVTGARRFSGPYALAAIPRYAVERGDWRQAAKVEPTATKYPFADAMSYFAVRSVRRGAAIPLRRKPTCSSSPPCETPEGGEARNDAIKAAHGIVLAQDPAEARHASMPRTAITRNVVDAVLTLDELAAALPRLAVGETIGR